MPGIASATGLISARIQPVRRPKPKVKEKQNYANETGRHARHFMYQPFIIYLEITYT